ncbi:MAG TPA: helix-turn-helix transcriptional regulator [Caulobacteraceae bacterium]
MLGRDLTVLAANRRAASLLDAGGCLLLRDGGLTVRDRKHAPQLNGLVADAGAAPRCSVFAAGDDAILIEAVALSGPDEGPVALILRELDAALEVDCADLEPTFGVTPGEHQVIVELLKGSSSREIAQASGKSVLTIRTHVKRAYVKIGVKTRGQLFARLLPYLSIR